MLLTQWRSSVGRVVALALKYVAEVTAAVGADDLGAAHAEGAILVPGHSTGDAVEVGGPAAARAELVAGLVQGGVASAAGVDALVGVMLIILAREGRFGTLFPQDLELGCRFKN